MEHGEQLGPLSIDDVVARAGRVPFVVLVGWLEQLLAAEATAGGRGPHRAEAIRFRHDASLGFHSGDVRSARLVERAGEPPHVELTTSFAGLTGSTSPLPTSYIERMCRDDDDELAVQREFLDLFHHRFLGLFYRGLLKFDVPRSSSFEGHGKALDWVLWLAGFDPAQVERLTELSRGELLALSPLLVSYPANADRLRVAVRAVLHDVVQDAEVEVFELQGGFVTIEPSARSKLGIDMRLGHNSTLGRRAPAPASEIAIRVAPLAPDVCHRLSPGGDRHRKLSAVARLFTPETVRVAIELVPTHAPPARLGRAGAKLGRDSWLTGRGTPAPVCFELNQTL